MCSSAAVVSSRSDPTRRGEAAGGGAGRRRLHRRAGPRRPARTPPRAGAWRTPRPSRPAPARAARGGFTAVVAMPNTTPPLDDPAVVAAVLAAGERAVCNVVSSGCITRDRAGEALAPLGELYDLGVRIFTDDGSCVADAGVMRNALEYTRALPGAVIAQHAEDPGLAGRGAMHEGSWSSRLGIPGRPSRGRGRHRGPRRDPRRVDRRPGALPPRVDRGRGRA